MTDIRIEPYRPEYLEGIADLIVPIQREEFGINITYDDQPDLQDIPGFYQKGKGGFWVAVNAEGRVVGSISLLDIGSDEAALRKMFVTADCRGRESRLAARLLETLLAHAGLVGLKTIYLGTTPQFKAAHRFYEKHGFELIDKETLPEAFPVMGVDSRFYKISL